MAASGAPIVRPPSAMAIGEVTLERWRRDDEEQLVTAVAATAEHLRPFLSWATRHDRGSAVEFLTATEAGWEAGDRFEYAIRDRGGAVLGGAGLMARISPGGLEIGYWVGASHTRKGIATLASAVLTESAFALGAVDHVEIHHDQANLASGAVPARLGFRNVGSAPRTPAAPADTGLDVLWRIEEAEFADSPASELLKRTRGSCA